MESDVSSAPVQPAPAFASDVRQSQGQGRTHLGALTGLRFLAALGVVVDHYWTDFIWWDPTTSTPSHTAPVPTGWSRLALGGGTGVDCFFVLSGFILAYTYVSPSGGQRGTKSAFWIARVARIYPVYLVGLAIDAPLFVGRPHHLGGMLAAVLTTPLLMQAWLPFLGTWFSWNPPGWSLSAEAFFYALFPFLLIVLVRQSRRTLWAVAGIAAGLFALLPVILIVVGGGWRADLWWMLDETLYFSPLARLPEFIVGVALGLLYVQRDQQAERLPHGRARLPLWDAAVVALGLAAVGLWALPLPPHYGTSALVLPLYACIILLLAERRGIIAGLLARPTAVWLGDVSYSIYILHVPLWAWLALIAVKLAHVSPANPMLAPLYLAGTLVAAGLSYRYIETPLRAVIRTRGAAWVARFSATPDEART